MPALRPPPPLDCPTIALGHLGARTACLQPTRSDGERQLEGRTQEPPLRVDHAPARFLLQTVQPGAPSGPDAVVDEQAPAIRTARDDFARAAAARTGRALIGEQPALGRPTPRAGGITGGGARKLGHGDALLPPGVFATLSDETTGTCRDARVHASGAVMSRATAALLAAGSHLALEAARDGSTHAQGVPAVRTAERIALAHAQAHLRILAVGRVVNLAAAPEGDPAAGRARSSRARRAPDAAARSEATESAAARLAGSPAIFPGFLGAAGIPAPIAAEAVEGAHAGRNVRVLTAHAAVAEAAIPAASAPAGRLSSDTHPASAADRATSATAEAFDFLSADAVPAARAAERIERAHALLDLGITAAR